MSPLAFLARPERWLRAIHRYRGTLSAAPNFAYELCVKRIDDDAHRGPRPRLAAPRGQRRRAGEPRTRCAASASASRRYGFRPGAMTPVYGLAECTVGLPCPAARPRAAHRPHPPRAVQRDGRAEPAAAGRCRTALRFVACGRPLPGHEIRIVDDARPRGAASASRGAWSSAGRRPRAATSATRSETQRLFHGDWLDTGDLAYVADGEVYLTGRVKDIIIRGGRNIYPHELEEAVGRARGRAQGLRGGVRQPRSAKRHRAPRGARRDARDAMRGHGSRCASRSSRPRVGRAGRAARRGGAGAAAHGAEDLERQDPPRRPAANCTRPGASARAGARRGGRWSAWSPARSSPRPGEWRRRPPAFSTACPCGWPSAHSPAPPGS